MNMKKKTDRRTLYTIGIVKDAFLELIRKTPYDKINVTAICKEAGISRATFYIHFDNVDDVLDRVIDDALLFSEESAGTMVDMIDTLSSPDTPGAEAFLKNDALLPACQRIADSERYHALFMDSLISDHIIQRIAQHERDAVIPRLMKKGSISEEEAELIFRFMLHGTFAVNRSLGWKKDQRWYRTQTILSRFVDGGIREI